MTLVARSRIDWVALISAVLLAAQVLAASHFHFDDDAHHDDAPAHECSVCLITTSTNDGGGPLPMPPALEIPNAYGEQQTVTRTAFILQSSKHAGSSPRGPPGLFRHAA